jgi:hypothetical protein
VSGGDEGVVVCIGRLFMLDRSVELISLVVAVEMEKEERRTFDAT